MSEGKRLTMSQHLAATALIEFLSREPDRIEEFRSLGKSGSRVTLRSGNKIYHAETAYLLALEAGIPCATFQDSGHLHPPHFTGDPITVGWAIGPCTKEQARPFTKRFQIWKDTCPSEEANHG